MRTCPDLAIQSLHFCSFLSLQKSLETARRTWASCSHFLRASTLLVFRWGFASISIARDQRRPEFGHSWGWTEGAKEQRDKRAKEGRARIERELDDCSYAFQFSFRVSTCNALANTALAISPSPAPASILTACSHSRSLLGFLRTVRMVSMVMGMMLRKIKCEDGEEEDKDQDATTTRIYILLLLT